MSKKKQTEKYKLPDDQIEVINTENMEFGKKKIQDFHTSIMETRRIKDIEVLPQKDGTYKILVLHEDIRKPENICKKLTVFNMTETGKSYLKKIEEKKNENI